MTETSARNELPDLSTMTRICEEQILLSGPCEELMTAEDFQARRRRINAVAESWNQEQRTDFWHTLDQLCAEKNPHVRATPGLEITPENLASEHRRLNRTVYELVDPASYGEGFEAWGFYLYADPVVYSFTDIELARYSIARATAFEADHADQAD